MTTASTNTVFDNTSDAGFRTWVNEIMTTLITTLGVTQTADTGQLPFPLTSTVRPAANTSAGYYILAFNDTLQATSPIVIKIEFGSGTSTSIPGMWMTVGAGSNGSGTINGAVVSTRVSIFYTTSSSSSVTNYPSRACYNTTQGVLWMDWKQGGAVANSSLMSFFICRSVDNTGAPTATSVAFQGQSTTATAAAASGSPMSWLDYSNSTVYGPVTGGGFTPTVWCQVPYNSTTTLEGTAGQVFPCWQYAPTASTPGFGVTNAHALCLQSEIGTGSTVSLTILGSTSLTYISGLGASSVISGTSYTISVYGYLRLWQ